MLNDLKSVRLRTSDHVYVMLKSKASIPTINSLAAMLEHIYVVHRLCWGVYPSHYSSRTRILITVHGQLGCGAHIYVTRYESRPSRLYIHMYMWCFGCYGICVSTVTFCCDR